VGVSKNSINGLFRSYSKTTMRKKAGYETGSIAEDQGEKRIKKEKEG
jgi:hypothetical protein